MHYFFLKKLNNFLSFINLYKKMIKTANKTSNRIVGISSDDFFHKNNIDNKIKNTKAKKNNKKPIKNLSIEKQKKIISKKQTNNQKPASNTMKLPDQFFEQILEYELQLKLKFDPKVFFELINLYSSAIKFYENLKDDKFKTYNLGLNMLFAMPEVKSFMEGDKGLTKSEKKDFIEKKMQQSDQKITTESAKAIYQSKIKKNKTGKNVIIDECAQQKMSFKKRMEEKKKKYLSSNTIAHSIEEESNSSKKNNISVKINSKNKKAKNNKFRNKSVDIVKPKYYDENEDLNDEEIIEVEKFNKFINKKSQQLNINFSIDKNTFFDENEKEEIRNDINKLSLSGSGTDSEKDTLSFTTSDNMMLDITKFQKITNKTLFKEKLKINFDVYICQYYHKFIENAMNNIVNDYVNCGEVFEKKLYDSSLDYFNQIKEMETLINVKDEGENESIYNTQIQKAIDELIEDEKVEKNKIIEEGEDKVENLNEKYNDVENINIDKSLDIIKEQLKLDVVKSLNSYVLK